MHVEACRDHHALHTFRCTCTRSTVACGDNFQPKVQSVMEKRDVLLCTVVCAHAQGVWRLMPVQHVRECTTGFYACTYVYKPRKSLYSRTFVNKTQTCMHTHAYTRMRTHRFRRLPVSKAKSASVHSSSSSSCGLSSQSGGSSS
jgi:hypothetical protein